MIEFNNISKKYHGQAKNAVSSFTLRVESGHTCVLLGPSGCGKTTTLRTVNRMVDIDDGAILIDGEDITARPKEELRRSIGYVIQSIGLFPHLSVERNIAIVLKLLRWSREAQHDRVTELLSLIGLSPEKYRHKYPHELSGGEAQRIGVARALAADQNILLMDEPFGAVDPLRRETLQQEFLTLQRKLKKTVLFVTHDLDEAIKIADIIVIMKEGRTVQCDTPENILATPANRFVKEFIGEDRALKRLSRFPINEHISPPHIITEEEAHAAGFGHSGTPSASRIGHPSAPRTSRASGTPATPRPANLPPLSPDRTYWTIDTRQRITGMIKQDNGAPEYIPFPSQTFTLKGHHTLRDALSRALGLGIDAVPIINDAHEIIGEVLVSNIEKINRHGLTY